MAKNGNPKVAKTRTRRLSLEGVNPITGDKVAITLSNHKLSSMVKNKNQCQLFDTKRVLPEILNQPYRIFEGLKRNEDEPYNADDIGYGAYCYCGIPKTAYDCHGKPRPPLKGEVFVAFVTDEFVAYQWYWCKCDEEDSNLPTNHETRFRRQAL